MPVTTIPTEDIKDILENAGVGTLGTDLFISKEPDNPDACVTLFDTGGFDPDAMGTTYERPTIQARIRGGRMGYQAAYAKALEVRDALHALNDETWNSTRYIAIWVMGDIAFINYDGSERPVFTINFRIHRTA